MATHLQSRGGRPRDGLNLTPISQIARREGISESAATRALHRAIRTLESDGQLEKFLQIVGFTQGDKDYHPIIRCGSIECRPEWWVFFTE